MFLVTGRFGGRVFERARQPLSCGRSETIDLGVMMLSWTEREREREIIVARHVGSVRTVREWMGGQPVGWNGDVFSFLFVIVSICFFVGSGLWIMVETC